MENKMKEYLGNEYSDNHLKNFCLYWMKGRRSVPEWENSEKGCSRYDAWRKKYDLDCLYFEGDLRADTLMSAWTPIKWVADCLNWKYDIKFYKKAKDHDDSDYYLKLLAYDRDAYLPPKHELVRLLDHFLELAEERCNYILLPDRRMNSERYKTYVDGEETWLFDEVPAMLYHIYQKESLGKYFLGEDGEVDRKLVEAWIRREHLEMGFFYKNMDFIREKSKSPDIIPLVTGLEPCSAKWLTEEKEIKEALQYMIRFLEMRKRTLEFITEEHKAPDKELEKFINEYKEILSEWFSLERPSEGEVDELEKALGFKLPDVYKWFLNEFGAGGVNFEIYGYVDEGFTCLEPTMNIREKLRKGIEIESKILVFSYDSVHYYGFDINNGTIVKIEEYNCTSTGDGVNMFCKQFLEGLRSGIELLIGGQCYG